jgi:hypothetical protein
VLATVSSASVSLFLSGWSQLGRPLNGRRESFMNLFDLVYGASLMTYLFLAIRCAWERLWLGIAVVCFGIVIGRRRFIQLVGHVLLGS